MNDQEIDKHIQNSKQWKRIGQITIIQLLITCAVIGLIYIDYINQLSFVIIMLYVALSLLIAIVSTVLFENHKNIAEEEIINIIGKI